MQRRIVIFVPLVAAILYAQATIEPRAKTEAPKPLPRANIRIDTTVVLVPVTVVDPLNRVVTALEAESFQVFEDGVEQKLVSFGSEDAPLSIGIVFDTSGSMGNKLVLSRQSVAEFFKLANPEDEAFLVEFGDRPELVQGFTNDLSLIQNRLLYTRAKGETALLDGITLALNTMKKARNPRKALIVISDGGDNHSRYTEREVRERVKEADVQIYAMGIYGGGRTAEELSGPDLLRSLSEFTGGRHFAANTGDMPDIAAKIGIELRNEYLLGYAPSNAVRDGKYRKITVKVTPPRPLARMKLTPYWRQGYFAATQ